MLFKNRKRIILDRGPSWPDYDKAEPFVVRYYLHQGQGRLIKSDLWQST